ncbi:MAG: hypothetical protein R2797_03135 [Gelidibacter sp.]
MFAFQSLILNLFTWLTFLLPSQVQEHKPLVSLANDEVISTGQHQSPAIIELTSYLNQLLDTSQDTNLPFAKPFDKIQQPNFVAYEPRLLYFQIGNSIELELTSTTIIFPFHCFT